MNFWQGKRVRLRGVEPSDAETFFQWNQNSEMGRNLDFLWPPLSLELVRKQVQELSLKRLENDCFFWIIENAAGVVVGSIDTHHCSPRSGAFSYGIQIRVEHQRKGYASEAILLVLRYYFEELRYHKVTVEVFSHNPASQTLHENLGFMKEGVIRQTVYSEGRHYDVLYYGMTRDEWMEKHSRT